MVEGVIYVVVGVLVQVGYLVGFVVVFVYDFYCGVECIEGDVYCFVGYFGYCWDQLLGVLFELVQLLGVGGVDWNWLVVDVEFFVVEEDFCWYLVVVVQLDFVVVYQYVVRCVYFVFL